MSVANLLYSFVHAPYHLYDALRHDNKTERKQHRFLDHTRPIDAPFDGKNLTLRANVTPDGYCVEYRESLWQHFLRVGAWLNAKPMKITGWQMGKDRGLKLYGLSRQGFFGDRKDSHKNGEKPSVFDFIELWKWEAWESYRGTDKILAQKGAVKLMDDILREFDYGHVVPDPKRPGPDYYSECEKFNWVEALVKKHKEKTGFQYASSEEEMAAILKLTQGGNYFAPITGIFSLSLAYVSII